MQNFTGAMLVVIFGALILVALTQPPKRKRRSDGGDGVDGDAGGWGDGGGDGGSHDAGGACDSGGDGGGGGDGGSCD